METPLVLYQGLPHRRRALFRLDQYGKAGGYIEDWGDSKNCSDFNNNLLAQPYNDAVVFGKGAISGYSGPAVKPIGLRFIAEMAANRALALPLSGIGGIETWIDALEFLLVGASTVQVTTGIIHYGYGIVSDMIEGLSDYMALRGVARVQDLIGKALPHLHETGDFDI
ncbi:MAG: preA, partial [Anaerolineales bacterium]|nr:preA [Anaerolineales bacterium]